MTVNARATSMLLAVLPCVAVWRILVLSLLIIGQYLEETLQPVGWSTVQACLPVKPLIQFIVSYLCCGFVILGSFH